MLTSLRTGAATAPLYWNGMRHCWLLLAACLAWAGADPEFRARREALAKALPEGVVVLHGRSESDADLRNGFLQDSNFYYPTGWKAPGAALLIDPEREILFLPEHNPERERWTGRQAALDDSNIQDVAGFQTVLPPEALESEWRASLDRYRKVGGAVADRPSLQKVAMDFIDSHGKDL